MKRGGAFIAMMCVCFAQAACAADAVVEQPRAFGHVLGDMLTQRVLLSSDDHTTMPSAGRVSVWLERRQPRIEKDARGRSWMVIDYQIVNAASALTQAEIPAFELQPSTLRVAAWPISIGALTPRASFRAGDLQPLRPDRVVMPRGETAMRNRMMTMLALLIVTLASWLAWWSWQRRSDARRLPFARAWQAIRTLDAADLDTSDAAWRHLHRAFDEAAGQVVHAASLHMLFARAPWLEALKSQLEAFYEGSQQRFFRRDAKHAPFPLRDFARALYRAEKRR